VLIKKLNDRFFKSIEESINDKLTNGYGGIIVQEFTFKINNIYSQRSMGGVTNIGATCIQDNIFVNIEIKNSKQSDKEFIKQELTKQHAILLKINDDHKDDIRVGDVL
jgi:hypothetical protein